MQFKILLTGVTLLFVTSVNAHPDGATPYWYPSTYIYGFVQGCWETVEQNQSLAEGMWPDDIRAVCGCVVDALRHSLTYQEITDNETKDSAQLIVNATFPLCIQQELNR